MEFELTTLVVIHNDCIGSCKTFEVMTSSQQQENVGSVASLIAANLYQGNHDRNHKLWNIVLTDRYILNIHMLLECC